MTAALPKRLIEVDLPIKRISEHARREKSIRHGHISTLHIWWARRPLAACRAVICAALWPDPADPNCPQRFRDESRQWVRKWLKDFLRLVGAETLEHLVALQKQPERLEHNEELRTALLNFIADFSSWDNSNVPEYLETSRALTQAAYESLGGKVGSKPLVIDPFAGGGSIPLEVSRIGGEAFATDLNPVAVILNKVILEYIPKYGQQLADEVRRWGDWIKQEAEKDLADFYPRGSDGTTPIAYLWARTIKCEGPSCGAEVPLLRSLWLAKKGNRLVGMRLVPNPNAKRVDFRILVKRGTEWVDQDDPAMKTDRPTFEGTVKRGSGTCPCCGYTTPVTRVREQLRVKFGGAKDARLYCVVGVRDDQQGRHYRLPTDEDGAAIGRAIAELDIRKKAHAEPLSLVPDESTHDYHSFVNRGPIYGMLTWEDYFTPRQGLALSTLARLIRQAGEELRRSKTSDLAVAVQTCLALNFGRVADLSNSLCGWKLDVQCPTHLFARQALPMVWDFSESVCLSESSGSWSVMTGRFADILGAIGSDWHVGTAEQASATAQRLPDDSADAVITDPPYYYSVQYSDLADFFYVWMRRTLTGVYTGLLDRPLTPKEEEIIVQSPGHEFASEGKNNAFYESRMKLAMTDSRRVLAPSGIAIVVFAHTSTRGWESQLQAMIEAGWIITGSWPIDTEMSTRVIAQGRSVLASSVHLVCRPREHVDASARLRETGDWRDVLQELPIRIHEWMPRLAAEGVVGADAIFACLGPALEIFSRYSRVEKANGDQVGLKEYLVYVWAAVAKEALAVVFKGADASGFEEDARLTAMWLWTLFADQTNNAGASIEEDDEEESEESSPAEKGFVLEYDAARKIAQGLGAHLELLTTLVEVKGEIARLLPVAERTRKLFGKEESESQTPRKKKTAQLQLGFVAELEQAEEAGSWGGNGTPALGATVLDRVHQCMILFAAGRSEALRHFLVDESVGRDGRFWRLSQVLSYLYPKTSDEKRWIDGVLARKKGLGF
jgi:putative DNA methylase